jgi:hypothetical protein
MPEEAMVHVPTTALTQPQGGEGLEGVTLKPALLKVVQRTTNDQQAVPGQLYDTLSGQNYPEVVAVALAIREGRVYFPPGGDLTAEPICRSDNGIVPSQYANVPQSPDCASCEHGKKMWASYKTTGVKPDCQESWKMLFVTRDAGLPYMMGIRGMGIPNIKKMRETIYRDMLSFNAGAARRGERLLSIYDYSFTIKPLQTTNKRGQIYYVPTFFNFRRIENPGEFGELFNQYVKRQKALDDSNVIDAEVVSESGEPVQQYEAV